jgi:glycosyltransferase involved in cell wall biosynthesis
MNGKANSNLDFQKSFGKNHQDEVFNVLELNYAVVTPVRNEAEYIEMTIRSMVQQTIKPTEWVIVDDGSTDGTCDIVNQYRSGNPWIKLVHRKDRGKRQRGRGVVEAFYDGYNTLQKDFNFIVKLDSDLSFECHYFESLLKQFAINPHLGVTGGAVYEKLDGKHWVLQSHRDHVRGPTKVYRKACFEAIGGLAPTLGWDGLDEWKALSKGWEVQSFMDLKVYHYRITGGATGLIKSRVEQGQGAYCMSYHPLFLIARGIGQLPKKPYIIGGIAMTLAYFMAFLQGRERISDPAVKKFIRNTQLKKLAGLLSGKPVHQ